MMKSDIIGPYLKVNGKIRGYCERCGREVGLDEPGNKCPLCGAELYYAKELEWRMSEKVKLLQEE